MTEVESRRLTYLWKLALASFFLAALTGFVFRLGMLGWDIGLGLANVRHAHSHLMFFGWAVPMPLYILLRHMQHSGMVSPSALKWMRWWLYGSLFFGFASFPFFLLFGYSPVQLGTASLPFSVIFAGMVMVCWYGFMLGYLKARKTILYHRSTHWFDAALFLLFVCSLGAWGIALAQAIGAGNPLTMQALTHFFLSSFVEGWLLLVLIGILFLETDVHGKGIEIPGFALACIAIGAPLTFPYGISEALLSPVHKSAASMGGLLVAMGTGGALYVLFKAKELWRSVWIWPVLLLAAKMLMQFSASFLQGTYLLSDNGLRIFYLHVLLLGSFTLTMLASLHKVYALPKKYYLLMVASIAGTLLSLLLPTTLFPAGWSGMWVLNALAFFALLPMLAMLAFSIKLMAKVKKQRQPD